VTWTTSSRFSSRAAEPALRNLYERGTVYRGALVSMRTVQLSLWRITQMFAGRTLFALTLALLVLGVTSVALAAEVKLEPQNNSGQSATAAVTKAGDEQTKVITEVKGAEAGVAQPGHRQQGTGANLDPKPAFPVPPVVNGKSETTVNASLDSLEKGGYAINGHKSAQDAKTYVFCGPIASM